MNRFVVGAVIVTLLVVYFFSRAHHNNPLRRIPSSSLTQTHAQNLVAITSLHNNIIDSLHDAIIEAAEVEGDLDSSKQRRKWLRDKKKLLIDTTLLRLKTLIEGGQDNQNIAHDVLDQLFTRLDKYAHNDNYFDDNNNNGHKRSSEHHCDENDAECKKKEAAGSPSSNLNVVFEKHEGFMISENFVFSGEGCTRLDDQCSVSPSEAASLCLSFGEKCVGYTCNADRSDCQLRGHPINHVLKPRFTSFYRPGMFEQASDTAEKRRQHDAALLRKHKGSLAAKGFDWNGTCGEDGYKCVISYGLYGSSPKYTDGAIRNAELAATTFPGWVCRYYHDSSVPQQVLQKLTSLGAELIKIDHIAGGIAGMFWRFLVAADTSVDRYIVRDTDSRLNKRDYFAVQEWLNSGFSIHSVRDHPNHNRPLNGGMWGGVKGAITNISSLIDEWKSRDSYGADLDFLNGMVWPIVQFDQISHDSYSCEQYKNSQPFPTERKDYEHVGQVFENEKPRYSDISCCLLNNPAPVVCRKKAEWEFG